MLEALEIFGVLIFALIRSSPSLEIPSPLWDSHIVGFCSESLLEMYCTVNSVTGKYCSLSSFHFEFTDLKV